jgi:hypothetical protein
MILIAGLFLLFALAGVAFAVLAGLLKLVFKVAIFPVALAFGAVKLLVLMVGAVIGLTLLVTLGPVLLVVAVPLMLLALPLLLLGGLAWAAIHVIV